MMDIRYYEDVRRRRRWEAADGVAKTKKWQPGAREIF
jgi:hypothetical protein